MASKVRIVDVKNALVALLVTALAGAYGEPVDVKTIGKRDFADDGAITMRPPAVRVRHSGNTWKDTHDNQRLAYQAALEFEAWCFDSNKRSKEAERDLCSELADAVCDQLAGARLSLADGSKTEPIILKSSVCLAAEDDPADQLYVVTFTVTQIAQFSGQNANP